MILPNNPEAEKAIITIILMSPDLFVDAVDKLEVLDFYEIVTQEIWIAMKSLNKNGQNIDMMSVRNEVKKKELSGESVLAVLLECRNDVVIVSNLQKFIDDVKNSSILRQTIALMEQGRAMIDERGADASKVLTEIEKGVVSISEKFKDERPIEAGGILNELRNEIKKGGELGWRGYNTGFNALNKRTGGFIPTQIWIIGGYCMGKGTEVVMSGGGKKKIEDIKEGDLLEPVDSETPRKVLETTSGVEEMYEVSGKYIDTFTVNGNHILPMKWIGDGYKKNLKKGVYYLSVKDYLSKSQRERRGFRLMKSPANFKKRSLDIDPWLLGFWLGDGRKRSSVFAVGKKEKEILKELRGFAKRLGLNCVEKEWRNDGVLEVGLRTKTTKNVLLDSFRELNLLNNKHIPKKYMEADKESRLELLAGLIDSDGSTSGGGKTVATFTQVDEALIRQVRELAESLGLNTFLNKRRQRGGGKLVKGVGVGYIWRLSITGRVEDIPNRVSRKKCNNSKRVKNMDGGMELTFKVVSIGNGEYFGFLLDGNHLYLAQNYIVNHNTGQGKTYFALQMILSLLKQGAKVMLFSTEMDRKINMLRLLGMESGLSSMRIMKAQLDEEEKKMRLNAEKRLSNFSDDLVIYDNVYTTQEIRLKAKKRKLREGLDVVFIDFLQNLRGGGSIYERMSEAAVDLQQIAQELAVTMVVTSQVSQSAAGWANKDAIEYKGAGEIAAVADVGLWIAKDKTDANKRMIMLRKVRHGAPGMFKVLMDFPSGRVIELDAGGGKIYSDNIVEEAERIAGA